VDGNAGSMPSVEVALSHPENGSGDCPKRANVVCDSRTDNQQEYESHSETRRAALSHKAELAALYVPIHPVTE
jgi:hypothetical protein